MRASVASRQACRASEAGSRSQIQGGADGVPCPEEPLFGLIGAGITIATCTSVNITVRFCAQIWSPQPCAGDRVWHVYSCNCIKTILISHLPLTRYPFAMATSFSSVCSNQVNGHGKGCMHVQLCSIRSVDGPDRIALVWPYANLCRLASSIRVLPLGKVNTY